MRHFNPISSFDQAAVMVARAWFHTSPERRAIRLFRSLNSIAILFGLFLSSEDLREDSIIFSYFMTSQGGFQRFSARILRRSEPTGAHTQKDEAEAPSFSFRAPAPPIADGGQGAGLRCASFLGARATSRDAGAGRARRPEPQR
ncbi:hypothetical protein HLV38_05250 [Berryella wangjianweii]|uniref:Uncharacterized protein n=1 Tax=Berryella wangjianweii TaxID=2734634 RepID=A0A6M8J7P0_9ACTN|nr:hypothetical protein [Berryella wangjianweii]QKF07588.1 hypothetical protein HLV38_05250 [Berryella wangjianweii]